MSLEAQIAEARAARLHGRVVIVTGATGGVGRGIVRRLAANGATVIATSRDAARAEALACELAAELGAELAAGPGAEKPAITPAALDPTDPDALERLVAQAVERYGRLDLLCNNAAAMHVASILEVALDDLAHVMQVNVGGVLIGAQAAARQMRRQAPDPDTGRRGAIINVSSPAADNVVPVEAAYGASKAAVNHLTKTLAAVLGPEQISVTALYPGNVWEGMQSQLHHLAGDPPGPPAGPSARGKLEGWPSGRWQRPDDTGDMVAFIASFVGMGLNGDLVVAHPLRHRL